MIWCNVSEHLNYDDLGLKPKFSKKFVYHLNTVEPPCATTSRKRSSSMSDRQSKTPKFPSQSLTVKTSSKRPPPVSFHDHFLRPDG